ncbi:MAG: FtsX-like permease family protein [Treponema sp.]|nr:FtsX-like permease family protein [Candidatus Treponema caballi]
MKDTLKMGLRSLVYRRKQYTSLMLVCMFGIGISLFCLFLVDGMLESLQNKARIYYGGDYLFQGGDWNYDQLEPEDNLEVLKNTFPGESIFSKRFHFDAANSAFYYEGVGVRMRVIQGIDFTAEKDLFATLNYREGSAADMAGSDGILLSAPIADMLEVHAGDEITFMLYTNNWAVNTVSLVVKGIFQDSSLFGMYTAYMDIDCLKAAYGYPSNWCNRICITVPSDEDMGADYYQAELEKYFTMYPQVDDKQLFYDHRAELEFPNYALIKLSANLQDVQILIDAMKLISSLVILILVIIIVAGVSSSFRVIAMKRINEIGIYKAIGMKRQGVLSMLLTESSLLVTSGCIAGFLFSLLLSGIIRIFNFSFIPAFDIFLNNGSLKPIVNGWYVLILSAAVIVTTLVAVLFSVRKSVTVTPCEALSVNE